VVSFTLSNPQYPVDWTLAGLYSWPGSGGDEKFLPLPEMKPRQPNWPIPAHKTRRVKIRLHNICFPFSTCSSSSSSSILCLLSAVVVLAPTRFFSSVFYCLVKCLFCMLKTRQWDEEVTSVHDRGLIIYGPFHSNQSGSARVKQSYDKLKLEEKFAFTLTRKTHF
jgi:hypothetical protein